MFSSKREAMSKTMIKLYRRNEFWIAGALAVVFLSSAVQAANCTLGNWSGVQGLVDSDVGTPADGEHRRYSGPCGLRVPLAGSQAYVEDTSPASEDAYNVRFYFFLNDVDENVTIFKAENADDGSGVSVISATYNASVQKVDVVFSIGVADGSQTATVTTGAVASGWNSLEIQWSSASETKPKVILNDNAAVEPSANLNTSNYKIELAKLGAISTPAVVPVGGSIDFDDFDSRRDTAPGRLCRGLTDSSRTKLTFTDAREIFKDAATNSYTAPGQPDYDLSGTVTFTDARTVFARAVSTVNRECSENR